MYFQEKVIDGVLCYRHHPHARFVPYTPLQLTKKLQAWKKNYQALEIEHKKRGTMLVEKEAELAGSRDNNEALINSCKYRGECLRKLQDDYESLNREHEETLEELKELKYRMEGLEK